MKKKGYLHIPRTEKAGRGRIMKRHPGKSSLIAASPEPGKQPDKAVAAFQEGQAVELLISGQTEIGYKAIINNSGEGLLYKNEVFQELRKGELVPGFIKKVRDDGKIDLCLHKPGVEKIDDTAEKILDRLKELGGFIAVDDKSQPELIYGLFGVSKKTFKKAAGSLYKKRLILIESGGIRLAKDETGRP